MAMVVAWKPWLIFCLFLASIKPAKLNENYTKAVVVGNHMYGAILSHIKEVRVYQNVSMSWWLCTARLSNRVYLCHSVANNASNLCFLFFKSSSSSRLVSPKQIRDGCVSAHSTVLTHTFLFNNFWTTRTQTWPMRSLLRYRDPPVTKEPWTSLYLRIKPLMLGGPVCWGETCLQKCNHKVTHDVGSNIQFLHHFLHASSLLWLMLVLI